MTTLPFAAAVAALGLSLASAAPSLPLPTDRGRIKVADFPAPGGGPAYKVLRTEIGTPLRGACAGFTKTIDTLGDDVFKPEYFDRLRREGINTLKLAAYDGIWRGIDFNNQREVDSVLAKFEKIINLTSSRGMYSVITYHPKFGIDPEDYMTAFWKAFAPKFANRTHVIYELTNEPVGNIVELTDEDYRKYKRIYDLIRASAPDTHIILFSCATLGGDSATVKAAADRFNGQGGIDWTRTSVGYHLYYTGGSAAHLRVLHRAYPAFPTEQNYPKTPEFAIMAGVRSDDPHRSQPMDGETFAVQTAEKMGAGWFHWHWENIYKFDANYPLLKKDALAKGYFWGADPYTPPATGIRAQGTRGLRVGRRQSRMATAIRIDGRASARPGRRNIYSQGTSK